MFGPELQLKEVKFKFFSPSLPSRTYSRAKYERMRKGQRNLRKKAKEEKKAERRLSKQGDSKKRVKVVKKKVFRCMESVDAAIRKVLGKTAKTRVAAKSRVKEEEVNKCAPGSNSSMRSIAHEARQERKVKMRGSGGSRAVLVTQQETCHVGSLPDQVEVTISDVGMEEWLEAPTSCDQDGQLTLDLTGPEQSPMEPMPPCMEFFQVEIFSVMMKCTLIIFQPLLRFQSSLSRSTVSISALPPPTWACGPSPHLVASLCHPSTAPCRHKSSVDPADLWQRNLLLKAPCCRILNQELKEDLWYSTNLQKNQRKKEELVDFRKVAKVQRRCHGERTQQIHN